MPLRNASLAVGLVLLLSLPSCREAAKPQLPPPVVQVTQPLQQRVPEVREWVGTLTGLVNADIRAQVEGYLVSQDYPDGSLVRKGQTLFQIDPRPFQAVLDQAQGNLAEVQAQLIRDTANAQRAVELLKKNVISQEQYDDQMQAYEASKAAVQASQAAVESARLNLGFTRITSPVDGLAGIATAQVGNLIGPSSGVLTTVTTVDPIKARFYISENEYLNYIKPAFSDPTLAAKLLNEGGFGLQLVLSGDTVYPQPGRILSLDNVVNNLTGTIEIEGLFPNPENLLRAGQFTRVRAVVRWFEGALLVPQRAINDLQGRPQIGVVGTDGKVDLRLIETGPTYASLVVVTKGLSPGEQVIVEGVQKVRQGMEVKTTEWKKPPDFNLEPPLPAPSPPPAGSPVNTTAAPPPPAPAPSATPPVTADPEAVGRPSPTPQASPVR